MEFKYKKNYEDILPVLKNKGAKKNIAVADYNNSITIMLAEEGHTKEELAIPVSFSGKFTNTEGGSVLKGNFKNGFYLTTLVIFGAALIIARAAFSIYMKQWNNLILCLIVTALLALVIAVVKLKSKVARKVMIEFLTDLQK